MRDGNFKYRYAFFSNSVVGSLTMRDGNPIHLAKF